MSGDREGETGGYYAGKWFTCGQHARGRLSGACQFRDTNHGHEQEQTHLIWTAQYSDTSALSFNGLQNSGNFQTWKLEILEINGNKLEIWQNKIQLVIIYCSIIKLNGNIVEHLCYSSITAT